MKTIAVVAMVIVVGIFIGIIATADYGDFVKERELRNLELSFYELQQKIKQCEELSGYSQETCYIELKRFCIFLIVSHFAFTAQQELASDVAQARPAQSVAAAAPINAPVYDVPVVVHVAANVGSLSVVNVLHFAFTAQQVALSKLAQARPAQLVVVAASINAPV